MTLFTGSNTPKRESHPLSPESPDIAVSSFNSFRNTPVSAAPGAPSKKKKIVSAAPPEHIQAQQATDTAPSMDFVARQPSRESNDELFAKPLSPRTPADTKSPFSFSNSETMPYLKQRVEHQA